MPGGCFAYLSCAEHQWSFVMFWLIPLFESVYYLSFKHVCNFFPSFRLQSYNFFPINPSTFSNFLPIEVLIVIKILVAHQLCHIPTLPFFGVMQSYILQARTGDRSLSRRHERPLLWTVYQWSQCSAQMLWHHSIRLLIQDSDVLNVLGVKELKELSHLYYYLTCKFSKKSSHCPIFFMKILFDQKKVHPTYRVIRQSCSA